MAAVALEGVSKTFAGSIHALSDLHLQIDDQELVVLVGPSGCGKTTTLRLIAGLDAPDCGHIRIAGRVVNGEAPRARNVAMVFQQSVLYPHLTVADNLAAGLWWHEGENWLARTWRRWRDPVGARGRPGSERDIRRRVRHAAGVLGIGHLLARRPGALSGGEQQRVALGRALVRRPAAFLLDEPLSQVDAPQRGELRQEIRRVHERSHSTMVYVTHDQAEAMALGDRLVVMERGAIQQVGPPRDVYDRPATATVARLVGAPGMNLIPGRWQRQADHVQFCHGDATCILPYPTAVPGPETYGSAVVMGIRPEHCTVLPLPAARAGGDHNPTAGGGCPCLGPGEVLRGELLGSSRVVRVRLLARVGEDPDISSCWQLTGGPPRRIEWAITVPVREAPDVGRRVAIGLDPSRVHWFHAHTGHRLAVAPAAATRSTRTGPGRLRTP
ncbi:MAG: ABC transporter ATP-binding protein [Pirellulaceae bacterium]|jgi:ABC-type sugar transport system ATPase subunit|nr:ABC transporter ATP-binding protein [Pirellulaceae bacterium]